MINLLNYKMTDTQNESISPNPKLYQEFWISQQVRMFDQKNQNGESSEKSLIENKVKSQMSMG